MAKKDVVYWVQGCCRFINMIDLEKEGCFLFPLVFVDATIQLVPENEA